MIKGINKMVRCINSENRKDITFGNIYEVYNESENYYLICDDKFDKHLYKKSLFKDLGFSCFEVAIENEEEILKEVATN